MTLHIRQHFAPRRVFAKYFARPRALNDYATHIPVLMGLARLRDVKSVLEFGCGDYSTLTFLNRPAFPNLVRLQSVENDAAWAESTYAKATSDERWTLQLVQADTAEAVSDLDLEAFDLILIDDSKTSAERAATIRAVANKRPQHAWIAIHDFEVEEYRQAAAGFTNVHRFRGYNPETGLVWNSAVASSRLKSLDRILKDQSKALQPDDVEGWSTALRQIL
jgi:Methyltransferase domain